MASPFRVLLSLMTGIGIVHYYIDSEIFSLTGIFIYH